MPLLRPLLALLACAGPLFADDWPQWLGPTRDSVSREKVSPWTEPPKALWRKPVAEGHSSPIVVRDRVFLHVRVAGKDEEEVLALNARSGEVVWHQTYARAAFKSPFGVGPRATPSVQGDKLYTLGVTGVLTCWEEATGKQVWQVDTLKEFNAPNLTFGVSCSPLIEGDLVLVNVGGPGASIVAFRKNSGEVAWKALDDKASYSSPIAVGAGANREVIFLTQQGLVGLSPADGKVRWKSPLVDKLSESSTTPVISGDLLIGSSVTTGSVALTLKPGEAALEAWKNPKLSCYISTPVAAGKGETYLVTGTIIPPPSAALRCVETSTGKILWSKEGIGQYHAALLRLGDGKLLMLDDGGNLSLLDPDPKEYKELARSKVCGGTWAHPALTGGRLYLRDRKELVCLSLGE
ncbi:MAG: PQQ-like beta-propeller repeat protein [Planctomycetes bacterium]|nr:PQQ-like beta-propeller repeat protein [Planctomycetota bacterium]